MPFDFFTLYWYYPEVVLPAEQRPGKSESLQSRRDSLVYLDTPNFEGFPIGTVDSLSDLLHWSHGPTALLLDTVERTGAYTFIGSLRVRRNLCDPGESEAQYIGPQHVLEQDATHVRAEVLIDSNHTRHHFLPSAGLGDNTNPLAAYRIVRAVKETGEQFLPQTKTLLLTRASKVKYTAAIAQGKTALFMFEKDERKSSDTQLVGSATCTVDDKNATTFGEIVFEILDRDNPRITRPHLSSNKFIEMLGLAPSRHNVTGSNSDKHGIPFYSGVDKLVVYKDVYEDDFVVVEAHMNIDPRRSYSYTLNGMLQTARGVVAEITGHKTIFMTIDQAKHTLKV